MGRSDVEDPHCGRISDFVSKMRAGAHNKLLQLFVEQRRPPVTGLVAFAISGDTQIKLQKVVISVSNKLGRPLKFLHGQAAFPAHTPNQTI
jgi:hypothetical protein